MLAPLLSLKVAQGMQAGHLTLKAAYGVSADGRVIVGDGTNPAGRPEGFYITIPAPGTGLVLLFPLRRRRVRAV